VGFPLGWWYNFVVDADEGVRVKLDGETVLDAWRGEAKVHKFTRWLGGGAHTLVVEYREGSGPARLMVGWSAAPAQPVFAAEAAAGPFEWPTASVAESVPNLATPIARATATAQAVLATMTAEARITPTPDMGVTAAAQQAFEAWAQGQGEPYRDVQMAVQENDGYFALVRVTAWFRPARTAPWEEREAEVECRRVGQTWQCNEWFEFRLTEGEAARQVQATATAVAAARATAIANLPTALRQMTERFGLEFVYVPAGEFLMGSTATEVEAAFELCQEVSGDCQRRWFENEQAQHQVDLPAFWIGKTEVTNAQYRPFIEAGGYMDRELWTGAGWTWREEGDVTQPRCWDDEEWNQPDHPVVCLSWYEAVAYARWLSRETGLDVRLPSEAQWEKAARGTDGRIWPWGDEPPDGTRLNYCDRNCPYDWKDEAVDDGYRGTAPAGSYPAGASPYGALDMAGNVWEWTSTLWGGCEWPPGFAYPYRADDGREEIEGDGCRVVRGGSWFTPRVFARAAFRYWLGPGYGYGFMGVRVVVVPR
jgi:formylglycine-generating enzyme required for sulfatase activity